MNRSEPFADDHHRSASVKGEPRNLSEYVVWFLREWALEMPDRIHKDEVFVGPPDNGHGPRLAAKESRPDDLVGGSLLGTPAYHEPTRRLVEEDNPHAEEPGEWDGSLTIDKHLTTPLRSAMRRTGRFMEGYLAEVARFSGDWMSPARRRGCMSDEIARVYANEAFRRLWREYRVDHPTQVDNKPRGRTYSDWTDLSDSQRAAILDGETAA
jgi:hypothetical protein